MFLTESSQSKFSDVSIIDVFQEMLEFQESFESLKDEIIHLEHDHAVAEAGGYLSEADQETFGSKMKAGAGRVWEAIKKFLASIATKFAELYGKLSASLSKAKSWVLGVPADKQVPGSSQNTAELLTAIKKANEAPVTADEAYSKIWEEAEAAAKKPVNTSKMEKAADEFAKLKAQLGEIDSNISSAGSKLKSEKASIDSELSKAEQSGDVKLASQLRKKADNLAKKNAKSVTLMNTARSKVVSAMSKLTTKMKDLNDKGENV